MCNKHIYVRIYIYIYKLDTRQTVQTNEALMMSAVKLNEQPWTQLMPLSSPSLSMIVTVAAELGPTCTPLEMRSSGIDRSSWKDSVASITLSSVMSTVNSALVWPAGKYGMNFCGIKSSPPWEKKAQLVKAKCWCIMKSMRQQIYILYHIRSLSPFVHQTNSSLNYNTAGMKKTIEGG